MKTVRAHISKIVDFAQGRLSPDESLQLLEEIERDPEASTELDLIVEIMCEATDPESKMFQPRRRDKEPFVYRTVRRFSDLIHDTPVLLPAGAFGVVVAVLIAVLYANQLFSNRYEELTGIDRTAFQWNVRGSNGGDLAGAYQSFTNGDYDASLVLLDRLIRSDPGSEVVEHVHYTAGAVCLISSKRNFLILFLSRNTALVNEGLDHLSVAIARTSNRRLIEESRFLRAKGFLMLGRPDSAVGELDSVVALRGPRMDEAEQMIERIHAIAP